VLLKNEFSRPAGWLARDWHCMASRMEAMVAKYRATPTFGATRSRMAGGVLLCLVLLGARDASALPPSRKTAPLVPTPQDAGLHDSVQITGKWDGGSCSLEGWDRIVYTYGTGPDAHREVHRFGDPLEGEDRTIVLLHCDRRHTVLATARHYYGFPGADDLRARERASGGVQVTLLRSSLDVPQKLGPPLAGAIIGQGPVTLHSSGRLYYTASRERGQAGLTCDLQAHVARGSVLAVARGTVVVAIPGSNVLIVARLPSIAELDCVAVRLNLGELLQAPVQVRQRGRDLELWSHGEWREIVVKEWGLPPSVSIESPERARCRAQGERFLDQAPASAAPAGFEGIWPCENAALVETCWGAREWAVGRPDSARTVWQRASGLAPGAVAPLVVRFLRAANRMADAESFVKWSLRQPAQRSAAAEALGRYFESEGAYAEAAQVWLSAARYERNRGERAAFTARAARLCLVAGEYPEAITLAGRALRLQSHSRDAAWTLAMSRLLAGNAPGADAVLRALTKASPDWARGRAGQAMVFSAMDDSQAAWAEQAAATSSDERVASPEHLMDVDPVPDSLRARLEELRP